VKGFVGLLTTERFSGTYMPEDDDKNEPIQSASSDAINHTALFGKPLCCCENEMHPEVWLLSLDSALLVLLE
jgi:hypothetical protein